MQLVANHRGKSKPRRRSYRSIRCGDNVIADIVNGSVVRSYCTPILDGNVSTTDHTATPLALTHYYNNDERQSVVNLTNDTGVVVKEGSRDRETEGAE